MTELYEDKEQYSTRRIRMGVFRVLGVAYICMFVFYFAFRAFFSLGTRHFEWRLFVFFVELFASASVLFVVFIRIRYPWEDRFLDQEDGMSREEGERRKELFTEDSLWSPSKSKSKSKSKVWAPKRTNARNTTDLTTNSPLVTLDLDYTASLYNGVKPYNVRCLIPCYKEGLTIVSKTALAALQMEHPTENLFVYICDDGDDPLKQAWVKKMNGKGFTNLFYISRPQAYKGHAKAGNLNYTLSRVIYRKQKKVNKRDLIAIFDADMVCASSFAKKLIPMFNANKKVVMVQTPQTFHNVSMETDFFDAHNINFFQYMLPAMSSWNTTTCCGTNFLVGARALSKVGWFPTLSITEDMYLAVKLLAKGGLIKYHPENLVVGEAPIDMRQIFQQRSRWAKGTIQIAMKDNPLWNPRLNWVQRLSFFNACWSYITSAFMNPLFVLVNSLAVCFGLFPVREIDFATAMFFVAYYSLFYLMIHYTPIVGRHYTSLWVVGKMGHFFSFMSMKAIFNVVRAEMSNRSLSFKVTQKKVGDDGKVIGKARAVQDEDEDDESDDDSSSLDLDAAMDSEDDIFDSITEYTNEDEMESIEDLGFEKEPDRDSTHRDIRYHIIMVALILFVIIYGIYLVLGMPAVLPDIPDERSFDQKRGIRLFCICWMFQFLIAYSIPIWYAYIPSTYDAQKFILRTLAITDTVLSVSLFILTVVLFNVSWGRFLPGYNSIEDYTPSSDPQWLTADSDRRSIYGSVYAAGDKENIPVFVIQQRPFRRAGLKPNTGDAVSYPDYERRLARIAAELNDLDFPATIVMEPLWVEEVLYTRESPYVTYTESVEAMGNQTDAFLFNRIKFYSLTDAFMRFANRIKNKQTRVYIDGGNPRFSADFNNFLLPELRDVIQNSAIRGLIFNTMSVYESIEVAFLGEKAAEEGIFWVEDSSRNGGTWSADSFTDANRIESCRYDPPSVEQGDLPNWLPFNPEFKEGTIWSTRADRSDGRMYPYGESHPCLVDHSVGCTDTCPEIPRRLFFSVECLCR